MAVMLMLMLIDPAQGCLLHHAHSCYGASRSLPHHSHRTRLRSPMHGFLRPEADSSTASP
jgi:hypothetical protein